MFIYVTCCLVESAYAEQRPGRLGCQVSDHPWEYGMHQKYAQILNYLKVLVHRISTFNAPSTGNF